MSSVKKRASLPGISSIFGGFGKKTDGEEAKPPERVTELPKEERPGPVPIPDVEEKPSIQLKQAPPKRRVATPKPVPDAQRTRPEKGAAPNFLFGRALPVRSTIYLSDEVDRVLEQARLRLRNTRSFRRITRSELADAALKAFLGNPDAVEAALTQQLAEEGDGE